MQISFSANIVSGIYNVIEVVLSLCLLQFLRAILCWHNLKTLYNERKPLRLKSTKLSLFCDPGLAPPNLLRLAITIAVVVLGLTGIGGFCIVGITVPEYETVKVRNKVVAAKGNYIDFRDHVSEDGELVSGTVLLLQSLTCSRSDQETRYVYGMVNDLADLTSVKWPAGVVKSYVGGKSSSCLMGNSGFEDEVILELRKSLQPTNFTANSVTRCYASVRNLDVSDVAENEFTLFLRETDQDGTGAVSDSDGKDCSFQVLEVWCSNYHTLRCVVLLKLLDDFQVIMLLAERGRISDNVIGSVRITIRPDSEQLKSMAFLSGIPQRPVIIPTLLKMVMLRVESNAEVKRFVGKKDVTQVDVALLASTLGPAVFITVVTGLIACGGWAIFIARPGRRGYNKFNSASDALSCLKVETFRDGGCRFRRDGGALLEVRDGEIMLTKGKQDVMQYD